MTRLDDSEYDIDGLIVTDDNKHDRNTEGNPKYSRAFKLDLKKYETEVIDVEWRPSKDGLLKPVVIYEPVVIGGNVNTRATCNNARYIINNNIGKGAIIKIIRTNDVLPKIVGVVKPAKIMVFPDNDYDWNSTNVEFVLVNKDDHEEVIIQRLVRFFTTLKVENLSEGLLRKLYQNGFTTINSILSMTVDDLLEIDGFKTTLANKIYNNIHSIIDKPIPLEKLMTASNTFQNGFAEKKLKGVVIAYPDLINNPPTVDDIISLSGWNEKTAIPFIKRLPDFIDFLKQHPSIDRYRYFAVRQTSC
jgi:NAD-dependent DNA ligase